MISFEIINNSKKSLKELVSTSLFQLIGTNIKHGGDLFMRVSPDTVETAKLFGPDILGEGVLAVNLNTGMLVRLSMSEVVEYKGVLSIKFS